MLQLGVSGFSTALLLSIATIYDPIPLVSAYAVPDTQQHPLASFYSSDSFKMSTADSRASADALASSLEASVLSDIEWDETSRPERLTAMGATGTKFTPDVFLSAPRRSGLKPSADGTHGLYTVSSYSFESHTKTNEIRLFDMQTTRSTLLTSSSKASEPNWLEDEILYLKEGSAKGTTELVVASVSGDTKTYTAGVVPGSLSDVKLKTIAPGKVAFVTVARTTQDGKLWNPDDQIKPNHTGILYDSTFVRHWDSYLDTTKNSLWYGLLTTKGKESGEAKGRYHVTELVNALAGTDLESPPPPFGGTDAFDVSGSGLVFVAQDPELNPAFHTKSNFYYVDIPDFGSKPASGPRLIQAKGLAGAATSPAISPDGKMAVYMQMKEDGYEADKNRLLVVQNLQKDDAPFELYPSDDGRGAWDHSPSKAVWGPESKNIYLIAEHEGKGLVYDASIDSVARHAAPYRLTSSGHTTDISVLPTGKLLLSGDSLVDNSVWSLLELPSAWRPTIISSNTDNGAAFGLSHSQVSELWVTGAKGRRVQAWVLRPSNVPKGKKLPLAMLIHGGPQSAWADSWSNRWNLAVYAEQGYLVVAPNPTGSTSFGQDFTDAIYNSWGGDPYEDIVAFYEHIEKNMADEVDLDRTVALGASYGGYMVNWIQGHDLGRKFKALVCHDGVFSTEFAIAQEEQYFPVHDLGGQFWEATENYERWDPARFTGNWATPQLIIHSEKDYRLAMSEGLAAFNVLQARGVDSRLLYFPDENHWVTKEENSLVWHTVVLNWVNKYVGLPQYADEEKIVGPPLGRKYKKEPRDAK